MQNHRHLLLAAVLVAAASASAQTPPPGAPVPERDATRRDASNQRIEHIEVEDAGSRINELREGGQTNSITVQPKAAVPSYDVQPAGASPLPDPAAGIGSTGPRTWKVLKF